ncbi:MAG: glycosyltransferase family 2 protein [Firmicutes bacterium]|nr:glycosyltransferase family 2 protein [Bacillota bacterium]
MIARTTTHDRPYVKVKTKFLLSHLIALSWLLFSISLSVHWINYLGGIVTKPIAILIITGIAYIPGYVNAFIISSLLMDRQPSFVTTNPQDRVTLIIACRNEEAAIGNTLKYIARQDYQGKIRTVIVDNGSTDQTAEIARKTGEEFNLDLLLLREENPGKFYALNKALAYVDTEYVLTLDADTLLHKSAIRYIVSRIKTAPPEVCAVAGSVLVRNSRANFITKLQEWDYFLGIASIKRMQGLYQGTLVAQGAFSLYKTKALLGVKGWPDAIGEDIVLTWDFLSKNWLVYYEPLAVAFTDTPTTIKHLARQRSRWARGMIEALKKIKPWEHPVLYVKYLTGINLIMPYLDLTYTLVLIPGLILACFGFYWIAGPATLMVLPLALIQNYILYRYQRYVFEVLDLQIRRNRLGYIAYVFIYQLLMSPMSLYGYMQKALLVKRTWK